MTEDKYGRIWCHNFSGQLFYAAQEKLHLLDAYIDKNETRFPRLVLNEDELIATTNKGLFICELKNLKSRYISLKGQNSATNSVTVANNRVIAYGRGKWYSYSRKTGLKQLKTNLNLINAEDFYLHPTVFKDTLFLTSSSSAELKRLVLSGDSVKLVKTEVIKDFINTIVLHEQDLWINTKSESYPTTGNERIKGLNLTDIVKDGEGNTWYSSLKNGVMVKFRSAGFAKNNFLKAAKDDFVQAMCDQGDLIAAGTQNGEVIVYNTATKKIIYRDSIPAKSGSIERISKYFNGCFLLSASIGNFVLDVSTKKLTQIDQTISKDCAYYKNLFFHATTKSIIVRPAIPGPFTVENSRTGLFPSLIPGSDEQGPFLFKDVRCRALKYDSLTKNLYVAIISGLYTINQQGIKPVTFKNRSIHTSSIGYSKDGLFVGDFNRGLLIFKGDSIQNISVAAGLLSNSILKMKLFNTHLWIIGKKGIQLFNTKTGKIVNNLQLPTSDQGIIYDVLEFDGHAYIATSEGIYDVQLASKPDQKVLKNNLLYTLINNTDTVFTDHQKFPYHKNNILFELAAPWFNNPQGIYFKYRLINGSNTEWVITNPRERRIHYPSLSPGQYTFEARAIAGSGEIAAKPIKFSFTIEKPWWQQLWFILSSSVIILAAIFTCVWIFFRLRLKKERIIYEKKLAVEIERQRIGSEIHDDISAGLSALHLYTSLIEKKAVTEPLQKDINKINTGITQLSAQLREVIWALNTDHDSVENLIYYLHQQAVSFFDRTDIQLKVQLPVHIPERNLSGEMRRNIYLAIKESFQNIIKHASATAVTITMHIDRHQLVISVKDNGTWISKTSSVESSGIKNMRKRMETFNGTLNISFEEGTTLTFSIPI